MTKDEIEAEAEIRFLVEKKIRVAEFEAGVQNCIVLIKKGFKFDVYSDLFIPIDHWITAQRRIESEVPK